MFQSTKAHIVSHENSIKSCRRATWLVPDRIRLMSGQPVASGIPAAACHDTIWREKTWQTVSEDYFFVRGNCGGFGSGKNMQIKYSLSPFAFSAFCFLRPTKRRKRRGKGMDVSGGARFSIEQEEEGRRKKIREVRKLELTEEAMGDSQHGNLVS